MTEMVLLAATMLSDAEMEEVAAEAMAVSIPVKAVQEECQAVEAGAEAMVPVAVKAVREDEAKLGFGHIR